MCKHSCAHVYTDTTPAAFSDKHVCYSMPAAEATIKVFKVKYHLS